MKNLRRGFTLVEVSIFLAVTGALFAAVVVGVSNSIFQQRYNDATQSFAEFLRTTYAGVKNVQNDTEEGKSERVIYGKLLVFGETKNLAGDNNINNSIFMYTVVGDDGDLPGSGLSEYLIAQNANIVDVEDDPDNPTRPLVSFSGMTDSFTPKWSSRIEQVKYNTVTGEHDLFHGALLIVRHPQTGTIYTLAYTGNAFDGLNAIFHSDNPNEMASILPEALDSNYFKIDSTDFCVNPNIESPKGIARRNVKVIKNARNSSGIEIDATEGNICMTEE